jgi:hypothetical protein
MSTWGLPTGGEGTFAGGPGGSSGGTPPPVITSYGGSVNTSTPGASVTLSWSVTGSVSQSIDQGIGSVSASASVAVTPLTTTIYTLTATNAGGLVTQTFTIVIFGASAENVRWHQFRSGDRQGAGKQIQMFGGGNVAPGYIGLYDSFGNIIGAQPRGNTTAVQLASSPAGYTPGNLFMADDSGNTIDSGVAATGVLSIGNLFGAWYGQVPRGLIDGSNRIFGLDYQLANPYSELMINGSLQTPGIQGDPAGLNATQDVIGADYTVSPGGTLTVGTPPEGSDVVYIWYYRGNSSTGIAYPAATKATITVWTAFRSADGVPHGLAQSHWFASGLLAANGLTNTTTQITSNGVLYTLTQTTTTVYDTGTLGFLYGTVSPPPIASSFAGSTVVFQLNGTLLATDPNYLDIYDVYLTLTLSDSSVVTIRPITWAFTSGSGGGGGFTSWLPFTNYAFGDIVVDTNGNLQTCSTPGQSGSFMPLWATAGITSDGTAAWTETGAQTSTTGQIVNPQYAYDFENTIPPISFATFTRSAFSGGGAGGTFTVIF